MWEDALLEEDTNVNQLINVSYILFIIYSVYTKN